MIRTMCSRVVFAVALSTCAHLAAAATLLSGGDFESGASSGWSFSGRAGGFAGVVASGECYSANDTTGIVFQGVRAALIRSDRSATPGSSGILTSAPFTAGTGVAFKALTETRDGSRYPDMPVEFTVRILGADGSVRSAAPVNTRVVALAPGCYEYPVNGAFSTHYVDTRRFTGQQVRIQFEQSSLVRGAGLFTLVDEVVRLDAEDSQALPDRPHAVAGVSRSGSGRLRLDGSLSSDPAGMTLEYFWTVAGEPFRREGAFPCIDDLEPGDYQAALVVDNGLYMDADELHFVVRPRPVEATEPENGDSEAELDALEREALIHGGAGSLDCSDSGSDDGDDTESAVGDDESGDALERGDASDLDGTGIVWKPVSESDGNLVVLVPTSMGNPGASVFGADGQRVESGRYVGHTNGNRATYRFARPGRAFAAPAYLTIGETRYLVPDPAQRYN